MKIRILNTVIICLMPFLTVQPQARNYLDKFYFGLLYTGTSEKAYDFCGKESASLYLAFDAKYKDFYFRMGNKFNGGFFGKVWYSKNFGLLQLNAGYIGRPITMLNRPHPVSWGAHFEPPATAVIPASDPGMMVKIDLNKTNIYSGIYYSQGDTLEYNLGVSQKIDWFIFKSIRISGYYGEYQTRDKKDVGGLAVKLAVSKASLIYFAKRDYSGEQIQSLLACTDLSKKRWPDFYLNLVKKDDVFESSEIGIFKTFSGKVYSVNVHYMLGAGYNFSENQPKIFNIYFQTWLEY